MTASQPDRSNVPRATVLVVEGDLRLAGLLDRILRAAGLDVYCVSSARRAREALPGRDVDLVITERGLPDGSGLSLCRHIRCTSQVPLIVLSELDSPADRIAGFEAGCDDYIVKPFHHVELRMRVEALLRRAGTRRRGSLEGPRGLVLHLATAEVEYCGRRERLTRSEVGILQALMEQPDMTHSPADLSERVWGYEMVPDANFVQQHVSRLRRKLSNVGASGFIETVYGVGYMLSTAPSDQAPNVPAGQDEGPSAAG